MKNTIIFGSVLAVIFSLTSGGKGWAQNISINTTGAAGDASSILDVSSTNKGMLIPRVSLISNTDVATITAPATSLLVYNTNASMTNGNGLGYYYWDGAKWVPVYTTSVASGCADACVWTLVAVANSTVAFSAGIIATGYTISPGKEVLIMEVIKNSDFTFAIGDNPAVFEIDEKLGGSIGNKEQDLVLICPLGAYNIITDFGNFETLKIRGRRQNSSTTQKQITDPSGSFNCASCYVLIDGTGAIFLNDAASSQDVGLYIFER